MKSQIFSLEYPFELKTSPYTDSLEQKVILWIDEYSCLPEALRKRYKKSNFGKLATCFFPNATPELLDSIGRWVLLAFAFDDYYGSYSVEELKIQCQKVIDTLNGDLVYVNENEMFKQFGVIRNDLLPIVTQEWMKRFINDHQLWFEGMFEETLYSYREVIIYPSLKEYMLLREKISAGLITCDFLEIATGFIMPKEIFEHPAIQRIRQLITLMVSWFNDIHSVSWELERNEAANLVLVIKNEKKCSIEEAYEMAIEIHNNDLDEFIKITQNLPDFGKYNHDIKRYIHNAELFLKGQELWYFGGTERYSPKEVQ